MGMRKRSRAERGDKSRPHPDATRGNLNAANVPDHQHHEIPTAGGYDDEFMELDEDGGVSLDVADEQSGNLQQSSADGSVTEYLQGTISTKEDVSWRLPLTPVFGFATLKSLDLSHPIAKTYHKSAQLIWRHWKCDPETCIPEEMRRYTPYSSAMLLRLRYLASHTKGEFDIAQSMLSETWRTRTSALARLDEGAASLVETVTNLPNCEVQINENIFGLTLDDVATCRKLKQVTNAHRRHNEAKRAQKLPIPNGKRGSRKRAKVAKLQVKAAGRQAEHQIQQPPEVDLQQHGEEVEVDVYDGGSQIAERVIARRRKEQAEKPLSSHQSHMADELVGIEMAEVNRFIDAGLRDEELLRIPARNDRNNDRTMGQLLQKIDMNSQYNLKRKQMKRLRKGGFSRDSGHKLSLPSERVNLSSMDALHAIAPQTSPVELDRLQQLQLSDSPLADID